MTNSGSKVAVIMPPIIGAAIRCITYHVSHAPECDEQKKISPLRYPDRKPKSKTRIF
jgi:hypothetical protein